MRTRFPAAFHLGLFSCCLLALTAMAQAEDAQEVELVLEAALPYQPAGNDGGRPEQDVVLTLRVDEGGAGTNAWAWIAARPDQEHPVAITSSRLIDTRLELAGRISFLDRFPTHQGGQALVTVTAERRGRRWHGGYTLEVDAKEVLRHRQGVATSIGLDWAAIQGSVEPGRRTCLAAAKTIYQGNARESYQIVLRGNSLGRFPRRSERIAADAWFPWLGGDLPAAPVSILRQRIATAAVEQPGLVAAAWAALARRGDADAAAQALALAKQAATALSAPGPSGSWFEQSREVAGLALALAWGQAGWTDADRRTIADALRQAQRDLLNAAPSAAARNARTSPIGGPWDPRLATTRSAAGLAALALLTLAPDPAQDAVLERCRLTLRRFLACGLGESGAPLGHAGTDEALQLVGPFLVVLEAATGERLADGTGFAQAGAWAAVTGGRMFLAGDQRHGAWQAFTRLISAPEQVPFLQFYHLRHPIAVRDAWEALFALALAQDREPEGCRPPSAIEDQKTGALALRAGWQDPDAPVAILANGLGRTPAMVWQHSLILAGGGTEWLPGPVYPTGEFRWPRAIDLSQFQIRGTLERGRAWVSASAPGQVTRVFADPPHGGSCSHSGHDYQYDRMADFAESGQSDLVRKWQTVSIDFAETPAPALTAVLVASSSGFPGRSRFWSLPLGSISADEVTCAQNTFTVRPQSSPWTLQGTCIFPDTSQPAFVAAADGAPARIEVPLGRPNVSTSLETTTDAMLKGTDREDADATNVREKSLSLDDVTDLDSGAKDQREREAGWVYVKLRKVYTDAKMGRPYMKERLRNHGVLVLTLSKGPPPAIAVLPPPEPALLRIGTRKLTYWEFWGEFSADANPAGAKPAQAKPVEAKP